MVISPLINGVLFTALKYPKNPGRYVLRWKGFTYRSIPGIGSLNPGGGKPGILTKFVVWVLGPPCTCIAGKPLFQGGSLLLGQKSCPKSEGAVSSNGCFQKLGVPQNGWFIIFYNGKLIKMDDLEVPLFSETSK